MTFYNMLFTAFPLGIRALFDQDLHHQELQVASSGPQGSQTPASLVTYHHLKKLTPYIYRRGQLNRSFTNGVFTAWILKGIVHGFFIWLTSTFATQFVITDDLGRNGDFWFTSITMFTSIYLVLARHPSSPRWK